MNLSKIECFILQCCTSIWYEAICFIFLPAPGKSFLNSPSPFPLCSHQNLCTIIYLRYSACSNKNVMVCLYRVKLSAFSSVVGSKTKYHGYRRIPTGSSDQHIRYLVSDSRTILYSPPPHSPVSSSKAWFIKLLWEIHYCR